MRRLGTFGLVAAITACNGGAHEVGNAALARSQARTTPRSDPGGRVVVTSPPRAPIDEAPHLTTLTASARTRVADVVGASLATASGAIPPSGGFIVRGARPTAPTPTPIGVPAGAVALEAAPYAGPPRPATERAAAGPAGGGAEGTGAMHRSRATTMSAPAHARDLGGAIGHGDGESAGDGYRGVSALVPAPVTALPPGTRITVSVSGPPPARPAAAVEETESAPDPRQAASVLTAASVGDVDRRENYVDYLSRHAGEAEGLGLDMERRVRFRVVDAQDHPVHDALITLAGDGLQFVARTHADGGWDFYPSISAPHFAGRLTASAQVEGVVARASVDVASRGDTSGPVVLRLPAIVQASLPALDLSFLIDVTGSMGDELAYVNHEVGSIVQRIEAQSPGVRVRVSATFYRDRVDDIQLQQIPFTTNVGGFAAAMHGVTASGGGDYPEDMNAGLEAAMNRIAWSDGPAVRVVVLIADAPPQAYGDERYTYRAAMADAARRGIRILPVAASGADRSVEYLFRAMGAFTSTPYVYLTDDSGVGGPHMEADTDRVGVERFADMLTRLVISDLRGRGMHEPGALGAAG